MAKRNGTNISVQHKAEGGGFYGVVVAPDLLAPKSDFDLFYISR